MSPPAQKARTTNSTTGGRQWNDGSLRCPVWSMASGSPQQDWLSRVVQFARPIVYVVLWNNRVIFYNKQPVGAANRHRSAPLELGCVTFCVPPGRPSQAVRSSANPDGL